MELSGTFRFAHPRQAVWQALLSPDALRSCLPGCQRFEEIAPGRFAVTLRIGVAAVKGTYEGTVELADVRELETYTLQAEGQGGPGFVKATTVMRLTDLGDTTELHWSADARVGGTIAGLGLRMMGGVATHMAGEFFKCLDRRINATD